MIDPVKNRLAELMQRQGLGRRDLAVELDVSEDTIRRMQVPDNDIPSKYLPTLAHLLEATTDELIGLDRERATQKAAA